MSKEKKRSVGYVDPRDWKKHDDEEDLLYSYLKKKGKHKRAKEDSINK
tara:strand:- start:355 stop:498 length:144 start_codon:yes stop_codon:yes gene_type:complete